MEEKGRTRERKKEGEGEGDGERRGVKAAVTSSEERGQRKHRLEVEGRSACLSIRGWSRQGLSFKGTGQTITFPFRL